MKRFDTWVTGATIATCDGALEGGDEALDVRRGHAIGIRAGLVAYVGEDSESLSREASEVVDLRGSFVLPGLVDAHTHLVFASSRIDEFARKMAGEDYRAIAARGGGIRETVRATAEASDEALLLEASARANAMLAHGVTTIETKSGYGLSTDSEARLLTVAKQVEASTRTRIVRTFLGAHAVPREYENDRGAYVRLVVREMLPRVAGAGLADACDVYLDANAFSADEAREVLEEARALGLPVKAHVGQFADVGGAELLAELEGLSCDHLEHVSDAGLTAMARAGVTGVLLPGAWTTLRQTPVDARRMRAFGVDLAVATDCNPGTSPCTDLPLCAALAVRDSGLTTAEALLGITRNAARAIGREDLGRIRVGLPADLAVFEGDDPRLLTYALGDTLARHVYRDGLIVLSQTRPRVF
jgi:imidazolonepropionase